MEYASAITDELSRKNKDISNVFGVPISCDRDNAESQLSNLRVLKKNTQSALSISRYSECKRTSILRDVQNKHVKTKKGEVVLMCVYELTVF